MARGWESKSIENQQEIAVQEGRQAGNARKADAKLSRELQILQLSRTSILQKLEASENTRYREQLNRALSDLDRQIAALEAKS
jgi:hypothetical protein